VKELIESGYVGEVLSCHADACVTGRWSVPSARAWQRDVVSAESPDHRQWPRHRRLRFVAGNFARVSCMVTTQSSNGTRPTQEDGGRDFAGQHTGHGNIVSGAVASVHVAAVRGRRGAIGW